MSRKLAAAGGYRCIKHTPLPVMSSSLPPQSESESSLALQGACEVCPRRLPAPPAWEPSESESESREPASGGARHPPALPVMSSSLPAAPRSESESEGSLSREPASDAVRGAGTRPHRLMSRIKKRWAPTLVWAPIVLVAGADHVLRQTCQVPKPTCRQVHGVVGFVRPREPGLSIHWLVGIVEH